MTNTTSLRRLLDRYPKIERHLSLIIDHEEESYGEPMSEWSARILLDLPIPEGMHPPPSRSLTYHAVREDCRPEQDEALAIEAR